MMKLFICTDHASVWPVGGASVVVAEDRERAVSLLDAALRERHLKDSSEQPYTLTEVALDMPQAIVLRDGDY